MDKAKIYKVDKHFLTVVIDSFLYGKRWEFFDEISLTHASGRSKMLNLKLMTRHQPEGKTKTQHPNAHAQSWDKAFDFESRNFEMPFTFRVDLESLEVKLNDQCIELHFKVKPILWSSIK